MPRYSILADKKFDYILSKTGNAILRYRPEEAVCVIDSITAGKTAQEVLGYGGNVPVVDSLEASLKYSPDTLLIAIAPPGGRLPDSWREIICLSMSKGLNIVSGLHTFLSDDEEFSSLAKKNQVIITDLRRPPSPLPFSKGSWRWRKIPVLLTVGSDCDTGKMTTAWEIKQLLEEQGKKVAFIGTGQTGILLGGRGVAVDAVVSDFVAGCIEYEIDKVGNEFDLIIVEGQGSLNHMAYSGVTLGLIHGTMPDMLIMCHEPDRELDTIDHPIPSLSEILDIHLKLLAPFKKTVYAGISLLTGQVNAQEAQLSVERIEKNEGIPTTDVIRFGGDKIVSQVFSYLKSHEI
ncbi:MAG: DUF1611 domain-containing protein [Candidatus Marinimicrobia bacterium]|nr:DUF1611 domain-containing protein [Candidatus Neomarinimicrobiota bacterium]